MPAAGDEKRPRPSAITNPAPHGVVRRIVESLRRHPLPWTAVLVICLLCVLGIVLNQDIKNDAAGCYARQVREFTAGNWAVAFFPMTPPLMIVLSGLVAKLGIPPFAALKITSAFFFLAGLWPLIRILRRMLPGSLVGWGCLLYAVNPQLTRFASSGLLDSAKGFFLLCLADLLLTYSRESPPKLRHALGIGAALAGLSLARGEGAFFTPLILGSMVVLPWLRQAGSHRIRAIPRHAACATVAAVFAAVLCLPQALYIRSVTGTPMLDSRQTVRINELTKKWRTSGDAAAGHLRELLPQPQTVTGRDRTDIPAQDVVTPRRNLRLFLQGLDPFLLALAALALAVKIRRREWTAADTVCAVFILYNAALFASNNHILKRYIMPTIPFVIAWAVLGAWFLKTHVFDRLHRQAFPLVAFAVLVGSAGSVVPKLIDRNTPPQAFARWLEERRGVFVKPVPVLLKFHPFSSEYHDGRQPIVAATTPQYSYWSKTDWVCISHGRMFTPEEVRLIVYEQQADLLVVDQDLLQTCPGFNPDALPWLERVGAAPGKPAWAAYRILPGSGPGGPTPKAPGP